MVPDNRVISREYVSGRSIEGPRLPRGSRGPGYRVARDVSWGNLRLRALRIYLYLAPGILGSRGVKRKTRKSDTVPFPGSGDVAASRREDGPMRPYG